MPQFAQVSLAAALLLSALGAVIVCALVILYGFTGPEDEPPIRAAHRVMLTRIGHALATTCFAATAILIGMVLVRVARSNTPLVAQDPRVPELGVRLDRHASRVKTIERTIETRAQEVSASLARAESRLHGLERSLGRVADEGRRTESRVGRLETSTRAAATERAAAARAPSVVARTPSQMPAPSTSIERVVAAPAPATPTPPTPEPPRSAPEAVRPSPASVEPSALALGASKDRESEPPTGASSVGSSMPDGIRAKLRQDWKAIQQGFESSRDDLRRAYDSAMRKFRDLTR